MANKKLWAIMVAVATSLAYTLSFANGKYILTGNGEQVSFTDAVDCSQYLHKAKYQGNGKRYRQRRQRISEFNRSRRYDIYTSEALQYGL